MSLSLRATAMYRQRVKPEDLPVDIIPPILEHLTDRRDLDRCALVSRAFNEAATPILYRTLDSRIRVANDGIGRRIAHPSKTILQKPYLAKYVRHVSETATVGMFEPEMLPDCQNALRLCTNLQSFTWMDDGTDSTNDSDLLAYLDILQMLGVKELVIRTSSGISTVVWDRLIQIDGLRKIGIWCLHGQPRVLQGWSQKLGCSLTHLELGRCAGVPATLLIAVLSHLPLLKNLRLKGAPSSSIPEILSVLPNLVTLDTEYHGPGNSRFQDEPKALLRDLTVRASSVDLLGPHQLWKWIQKLIPRPSLESFTLDTFSTSGEMTMPRPFLIDLAQTHRRTMKHFIVDTVQITMNELQILCSAFAGLESLSCSVAWCNGPDELGDALAGAHNLRWLRLNATWPRTPANIFDAHVAKRWMLRENSRLRHVAVGRDAFEGHWRLQQNTDGARSLEFVVERGEKHDTWI